MGLAKSLEFFQIFYHESQLPELYDFAIPYKNIKLTNYFENSVIAHLVPSATADYVCVASWRLRQKRELGFTPYIVKDTSLSEEKILSIDADVMNLRPFRQGHQALTLASNWHGPAWDEGLKDLKKMIKVPKEIKTPIYENHFIARREIYQDYVKNQLIPTIAYMEERPEIYSKDSGYLSKLKREPERIRDYQQKTGRKDWPIGVFLLERLFSMWIDDKDLKIINV